MPHKHDVCMVRKKGVWLDCLLFRAHQLPSGWNVLKSQLGRSRPLYALLFTSWNCLTTEHTNNLNALIIVVLYACRHQVSAKMRCIVLDSSHAPYSLVQLPKPELYQAPCRALSNCTLVSKKEIHRRISRRTKNPSGVSNLWHSETIWGKQHTLT